MIVPVLVAAAVALVIVQLSFRWLRRAITTPPRGEYDIEELAVKYYRLKRWGNIVMVFVALSTVFLVTYLQYQWWHSLAATNALAGREVTHALLASKTGFFFPAVMAAVFVAGGIGLLIYKLILGDDLPEYIQYDALTAGPRAAKIALFFWQCVSILAVMFFVLDFDYYVIASPTQITVNKYWGLGELSYGYDEVESIGVEQTFRKQEQMWMPAYTVQFDDGNSWCSQGLFPEVAKTLAAKHTEFVECISEQSGQPIELLPSN